LTDNESLIQTAATVSGRLRKFLIDVRVQRVKQGLNPDKSPDGDPVHLSHYTTADGLQGIIQNGNLRASAAYHLNDSSEIDYGCQLFSDLLAEKIAAEGRDPLSKRVFEDAKRAFEPGGFMESVVYRTYVVCFCEDENLLSQWRTYGQTGGYSLKFPRHALETGLTVHDDLYHVELRKVIYKKETQIQLLQLVLSDLLAALGESSISKLYSSGGIQEKAVFITSFNTMLQTLAASDIFRFKHPAFQAEREWRLIVRPFSLNLSHLEMQQLKFRTTSKGLVVPYLELRPKEGALLPVASVRYGPTLEKKRVVSSLGLLFRQKGYAVDFHGSDIPAVF
jgi:hypothetical protein